jgi:hypothetical protein
MKKYKIKFVNNILSVLIDINEQAPLLMKIIKYNIVQKAAGLESYVPNAS